MPLPFNKTLDLKLIELVKENPILYNHNETKYMDYDSREVVWQKIGDELKRPARMCKSRWVNIRDMMRRKIKERVMKPDQRIYNYKYETELEFMMPFFKESVVDTFSSRDEITEFFEGDDDGNMSYDVEESPIGMYGNNESDNGLSEIDIKPKLLGCKRKKIEEIEVSAFMNDTANDSVSQELNPTDPVDVFLLTIGSTLKSLTPYYLNQAKSKIFAVVQEYELKQIVDKDGHPPGGGGP